MRWPSLAKLVPPALDAVLEGAGVTLAYLVVQGLLLAGPTPLGLPAFAIAAGIGVALVRGRDPGRDRTPLLMACAIGLSLAGWLAADEASAALMVGDMGRAGALHPGGWLAGLAFLLGARHSDPRSDDMVVERSLAWGLPALAIPWLLEQFTGPAARRAFVEPAFVATVTFVTTGLLAIALSRLEALRESAGADWRSNRPWLGVLAGVVVLVTAIALPLAPLLGLPVDAGLRAAAGPLAVVFQVVILALAIPVGLLAGALVGLLRPLVSGAGSADGGTAAPLAPAVGGPTGIPQPLAWGTVALLLLAALVVGWLVTRRLRLPARQPGRETVAEDRATVVPADAVRLAPRLHLRLPARHPAPANAVEAYLAIDQAWRDIGGLARQAAETPAAHTRRLRQQGPGYRPLQLLAADYQLVRYAGRTLTAAEERRAIARWRRLRRQKPPTDDLATPAGPPKGQAS
jgi:hypothetical protein